MHQLIGNEPVPELRVNAVHVVLGADRVPVIPVTLQDRVRLPGAERLPGDTEHPVADDDGNVNHIVKRPPSKEGTSGCTRRSPRNANSVRSVVVSRDHRNAGVRVELRTSEFSSDRGLASADTSMGKRHERTT